MQKYTSLLLPTFAAAFLLLVSSATAQETMTEIKQSAEGIPVGTKVKDFKLKNQAGKELKLSETLEKGPIALVFHRSASW
jgi:cytochrome oxidase Cu insertion factor (SCO1/SenC/PrrC family)